MAFGFDQAGLPFELAATVWAGARSVTVTVRDRNQHAIAGATVQGALGEEGEIAGVATGNSAGVATLTQTPTAHALWVTASVPGYRARSAVVVPGQTALTLTLDEDTLDFGAGLAGWTSTAGANAWITAHAEVFPGWVPCPACIVRTTPTPDGATSLPDPGLEVVQTPQMRAASSSSGNMDVLIQSMNTVAPLTVSRRFRVTPGTSQVQIRYRFATFELHAPAPQNDLFVARVTNVTTGAVAQEATSVFGLAGQLDGQGATGWRTRVVAVSADDEVEVLFQVQNAVDAAYVSTVEGDVVTEQGLQFAAFELYDHLNPSPPNPPGPQHQALRFLSVTPHSDDGGTVKVDGAFHVKGVEGDTLTSVTLEVLEGTVVRATASLAQSVQSAILGVNLGGSGVQMTPPRHLFSIDSSQFSGIDQTTNGTLTVQVRFVTAGGRSAVIKVGNRHPNVSTAGRPIQKLVRYLGGNRTGAAADRDVPYCTGIKSTSVYYGYYCGSDSWTLPVNRARAVALGSAVSFNDFSNANGGPFPIHSSHRDGTDVDAKWVGNWFSNLTAASAQNLIELFNGPDGDKIDFVLISVVTKCSTSNPNCEMNGFWTTIRNAEANGGRLIPLDVVTDAEAYGAPNSRIRREGRVRFYEDHEKHFHIRWKE